ncbi:MAG TPA: tyrosine-type recombinase/integrase [Mobilitalea sp.]|nr:tyrosine-type recombinase/integrase [Mobilitalea sp.]
MMEKFLLNELDLDIEETLVLDELTLDDSYLLSQKQDENFLDIIKKINKLPFKNFDIYYSDKEWDFSVNITINIDTSKLKFKFYNAPEEYQDILKQFVLVQLIENQKKHQSRHRLFADLVRFFSFLHENMVYDINEVTLNHLVDFFKTKDELSDITKAKYKTAINMFFEFYAVHYVNLLTSEITDFLAEKYSDQIKATREDRKYSDIPETYFNNLIRACIKSINSSSVPKDMQAIASLIIIISQTGLRISELGDLKTNALRPVVLYNGATAYYLEYLTWKREKGNNVATIEKTFINQLSKKAYDTLCDLLHDERIHRKTDYLFFTKLHKVLPLKSHRIREQFLKFYYYNRHEIGCLNCADKYPELSTTLYNQTEDEYITYPASPQFRVHVCTELYKNGVPLKYIQNFMGHLTDDMKGYYVRPSDKSPQEDMGFSKETIINIVTGDSNLLGSNASGLTRKIKSFIIENNFNIATDINEIADSLLEKIPIRAKTGGVCIKSSMFRECSNDAITNEFYCAYGVCPNIYHFYYMSSISYRQTKELVESIEINKIHNQLRQAQKELNKLKTIISNKLMPELAELKNELHAKGKSYILSKHQDLEYVITHYDKILEEISTWKKIKV